MRRPARTSPFNGSIVRCHSRARVTSGFDSAPVNRGASDRVLLTELSGWTNADPTASRAIATKVTFRQSGNTDITAPFPAFIPVAHTAGILEVHRNKDRRVRVWNPVEQLRLSK